MLCNAIGVGGISVQISELERCMLKRYVPVALRGVGPIFRKKCYVTLEQLLSRSHPVSAA